MGFFKELKEDITQSVSELAHSLKDDLEQNQREEMSRKRVIEDIVLEEPEKRYLAELEESFMNPEEDLAGNPEEADIYFQQSEDILAGPEAYPAEPEETAVTEQDGYLADPEEAVAGPEEDPAASGGIMLEPDAYLTKQADGEVDYAEPEGFAAEPDAYLTGPEETLAEANLPDEDTETEKLEEMVTEPEVSWAGQEENLPDEDTYLLEPDGILPADQDAGAEEAGETAEETGADPEEPDGFGMYLADPEETDFGETEPEETESKEDIIMNEEFENEVSVEDGVNQMEETIGGPGIPEAPLEEDTQDEEITVITQGTTISGSIKSDTSLLVKGTIEGDVECQGRLTIYGRVAGNTNAKEVYVNTPRLEGDINSRGSVKIDAGTIVLGNINCTSLVVAGAVKGDLDVNGPVVIDSTAVVKGNVKAKTVQINSGAVIDGSYSLAYADTDLDAFFGQ